MFEIDEVAQASPAKRFPPLGKLLLVLALLAVSLLASTPAVPLIVLGVGLALLFYATSFKLPRVIALAIAEGGLIILLSAAVIAVATSGAPTSFLQLGPWTIGVSGEGLERGGMVALRAFAGISVMLFFATSTPIPHLAHAMRSLRFPKELSELVILVYRYSFLILEQSERMHVAAQCRVGYRGWRNSLRTTGRLAVGMFTSSLDVAERSQVALHCRDFKGDFPSFRKPARVTPAWIAVPILCFASLFTLNLLLQGGLFS